LRPGREIVRGNGAPFEPDPSAESPISRIGSEPKRHLPAPAVAALGIAFLLVRILAVQGDLPIAPVLATGFTLLLVASVRDPGEPTTRVARMHPAIALVMGCAAVTLATTFAGPYAGSVSGVAVALTCLAAIAEEAFFRKFLHERLHAFGAPAAVLGSATLFAAIHVPAYGVGAFPIDLGAGLLFGWQRWASGSWKVPAVTHLLANLEVMFR